MLARKPGHTVVLLSHCLVSTRCTRDVIFCRKGPVTAWTLQATAVTKQKPQNGMASWASCALWQSVKPYIGVLMYRIWRPVALYRSYDPAWCGITVFTSEIGFGTLHQSGLSETWPLGYQIHCLPLAIDENIDLKSNQPQSTSCKLDLVVTGFFFRKIWKPTRRMLISYHWLKKASDYLSGMLTLSTSHPPFASRTCFFFSHLRPFKSSEEGGKNIWIKRRNAACRNWINCLH